MTGAQEPQTPLAAQPHTFAASLRLQRFGRRAVKEIPDPIVEPLWTGARVLAAVASDTRLFHEGREIVVREDVRHALAAAIDAAGAVLEGYLTAEAFATGEGAHLEAEKDQRRPLGIIGQALMPGAARRDRFIREAEESAAERARELAAIEAAAAGEPLAFVATDLLWLDGEHLLDVPLLERKRILDASLRESPLVRRTAYVRPTAASSLLAWRSLGFTMLALKGANSRYVPGEPNEEWVAVPAPTTIAASPFR